VTGGFVVGAGVSQANKESNHGADYAGADVKKPTEVGS